MRRHRGRTHPPEREHGGGTAWAGLLDDHLRRALGLPTAPAPPSTLVLWTAQWLDDLLAVALPGRLGGASWADVVALHPAIRLADRVGMVPALRERWASDIERAAPLLATVWTWPALHDAACAGRLPLAVSPAVARWMDEGVFARTLLARHPPPADALTDLCDVLDPALAGRLQRTCRAWGIQS